MFISFFPISFRHPNSVIQPFIFDEISPESSRVRSGKSIFLDDISRITVSRSAWHFYKSNVFAHFSTFSQRVLTTCSAYAYRGCQATPPVVSGDFLGQVKPWGGL
eukprot:UN19083